MNTFNFVECWSSGCEGNSSDALVILEKKRKRWLQSDFLLSVAEAKSITRDAKSAMNKSELKANRCNGHQAREIHVTGAKRGKTGVHKSRLV